MRLGARLLLFGLVAILLFVGNSTVQAGSEANFGTPHPATSADLLQGAGQWTASVLGGDRASAEITDPPGGVGSLPATVKIRNEASAGPKFLEDVLKFAGMGSSYSQSITVAEATNMEEVEQCWGGAICIQVDTGDSALLMFGGITAWRLTSLSDTSAASAKFSIEPTFQSFKFDIAVTALQFLLALSGTDCLGTALLANPDHLDSLLLLAAQVTPEFSGVADAIADSRFRDAAQEFVGAVMRVAPHVAVVLGGIIAQDAVVAGLCAVVHAKITGLTLGGWLLIRAGVFIIQKAPLAYNYIVNVVLADRPPTEIGVFYEPSGGAPSGITPEPSAEEEEPPDVECPPTENVDVALIIDSSGSMSSSDPSDQRLAAAEVFVSNAFNGDSLAVIDFDDSVRVAQPVTLLGADRSTLISSIRTIDSDGQTDIGGGIRLAHQELSASTSANRKAGILLTDGMHNAGPYSDAHSSFASDGWPIYVIGLGQPGSDLDPDFLNRIAADTGTGQYVQLADPNQLTNVYFSIATQQKCGLDRLNDSVLVAQGESRDATANIPPRQTSASFLASWPGSTVDLSLVDPSGREIGPDSQQPGVFHAKGLTYELYRIDDPAPGDWVMRLFGRDLPTGSETVTVQSASIPLPRVEIASPPLRELAMKETGGTDYTVPVAATAVVVAILVAGGGFWVFSATSGPAGTLMLAGAGKPPLPVRIGRRTRSITVGRARSNDIVIDDPYVSRAHARIRRIGDAYVVEDLGSTSGTLLNGSPISTSALQDGDVISIGQSTLTFRMNPRGRRG